MEEIQQLSRWLITDWASDYSYNEVVPRNNLRDRWRKSDWCLSVE